MMIVISEVITYSTSILVKGISYLHSNGLYIQIKQKPFPWQTQDHTGKYLAHMTQASHDNKLHLHEYPTCIFYLRRYKFHRAFEQHS